MCVWKFERVVWMVIDWSSLDGCGTAQFACTRRFPKDLGNMFSKDAGEHFGYGGGGGEGYLFYCSTPVEMQLQTPENKRGYGTHTWI